MNPNITRLTRGLAQQDAGRTVVSDIPKPTFRRGKVVSVAAGGDTTVNIGDDDTPVVVPAERIDSNYVPAANDAVDLKVTDQEVAIVGAMGDPTVFRALSIQKATIATDETPGSLSYIDMATAGPSVTVNVGPMGLLFVKIKATIRVTSTNDGGRMSFALSGANTLAASDSNMIEFEPLVNAARATIGDVILLTGLNPGSTTVTAKYRDIADTGTDVHFLNRVVWAVGL